MPEIQTKGTYTTKDSSAVTGQYVGTDMYFGEEDGDSTCAGNVTRNE